MTKKIGNWFTCQTPERLVRISFYLAFIPLVGFGLAGYAFCRLLAGGRDPETRNLRIKAAGSGVWAVIVWLSVPAAIVAIAVAIWKAISRWFLTPEQEAKVRAFARAKLTSLVSKIQVSVRKALEKPANPEPSSEENPSSEDGNNQQE